MQKRMKKGFTLAELLIVVAIIAVLVAIAVPLFVGALNDAKDTVMDANKRAVRGAAVEAILMDKQYQVSGDTVYDKWTAKAIVSSSGEVLALAIKCNEVPAEEVSRQATTADKVGAVTATADDYYVEIGISELKATPAT